jgi:hypothetical protein
MFDINVKLEKNHFFLVAKNDASSVDVGCDGVVGTRTDIIDASNAKLLRWSKFEQNGIVAIAHYRACEQVDARDIWR